MRYSPVIFAFLLVGCGSTAPVEPIRPSPTIPPAAVQKAEANERALTEIQTALTEILDRLEVMNARVKRLEGSMSAERVAAAPAQAVAPQPAGTAQPSSTAAAPGSFVHPPTAQAPDNAPVSRDSGALRGAEIAERYKTGLTLFGKNDLTEARRVFEEVLRTDPTGDLADNALYWIGETCLLQGKLNEAVTWYQRVSNEYPEENKAPDALLKLGMVYARLGDLVLARSSFEKLISEYPYSTPASAAKRELKRITY